LTHSERARHSPLIGYARVSTTDQGTDTQIVALKAIGRQVIRPDDVLVVPKLDHLGRSTRDVLNLVHEPTKRGALDTDGPVGKMVLTVLGWLSCHPQTRRPRTMAQ
jgi:DNA invertase Pin-like site-specific DNA recombinase